MLKEYQAGTIKVVNNSATVNGVGTSWLTYASAGDIITIGEADYTIETISSVNELTLTAPYEGTTAQNINYVITAQAPVFNLLRAKAKKIAEVNDAYLLANQTSFTYDGKEYSATDNAKFSLMAINGYIATNGVLPSSYPNVWIAMDGTVISILTVAQFKELYAAMVAQGSENFIRLAYLQAQINSLPSTATLADFDAIVW